MFFQAKKPNDKKKTIEKMIIYKLNQFNNNKLLN